MTYKIRGFFFLTYFNNLLRFHILTNKIKEATTNGKHLQDFIYEKNGC